MILQIREFLNQEETVFTIFILGSLCVYSWYPEVRFRVWLRWTLTVLQSFWSNDRAGMSMQGISARTQDVEDTGENIDPTIQNGKSDGCCPTSETRHNQEDVIFSSSDDDSKDTVRIGLWSLLWLLQCWYLRNWFYAKDKMQNFHNIFINNVRQWKDNLR